MKKTITTLFFTAAGLITINLLTGGTKAYSEAGGAPNNGACTACHGGTVNSSDTSLVLEVYDLTTGDPITEYLPGTKYGVDIGMAKAGCQKFGFMLNVSGGTLNKETGDNTVQIKPAGYATHTSSGTATTTGSRDWVVEWTAPTTGTVNFQMYINATNSDNTSAGDAIYGKSLSLAPKATGIEAELFQTPLSVYPQPALSEINVSFILKNTSDVSCSVYDLNGRLIQTPHSLTGVSGMQHLVIGTESMKSGIYLIQVQVGNERVTKKVLVQ